MRNTELTLAKLCTDNCQDMTQIGNAFSQLETDLNHSQHHLFTRWLKHPRTIAQNIGYIIYNCGKLAPFSSTKLSASSITKLLIAMYLKEHSLTTKAISIAFLGLGNLAQESRVIGVIDAHIINKLIRELTQLDNPNTLAINNCLYNIGKLYEHHRLNQSVDVANIQALLNTLLQLPNLNALDISRSLHGLGRISRAGHLIAKQQINSTTIPSLINRLMTMEHRRCEPLQLIKSLVALKTTSGDATYVGHINVLFNQLTTRYLKPADALDLIRCFTAFKQYHHVLNHSFTNAVRALVIPFSKCTSFQQQKIRAIIAALANVPEWQRQVQRQFGFLPQAFVIQKRARVEHTTPIANRPTHGPTWDISCKNAVFKAISNQDINELERLLGIKALSPKHVASSHCVTHSKQPGPLHRVQRENPAAQTDAKNHADDLVQRFFQDTDINDLKELLAMSSSDYFQRLLHACSHHMRYQLAREHALHPIVLYLPEYQLHNLIEAFINLELYRDSQAVISIVDALATRKYDGNTVFSPKVLQQKLLTRALEFHDKVNHHHVLDTLLTTLQRSLRDDDALTADAEALGQESTSNEHPCAASLRIRTSIRHTLFKASPTSVADAVVHSPRRFDLTAPRLMQADATPNLESMYTTEDMQAILGIRINQLHHSSIKLLGTLDWSQPGGENGIQAVLSDFLDHTEPNAQEWTHLVIPIAIGMHWVGLRISRLSKTHLEISYYDSLEHPTQRDTVMSQARSTVARLFAGQVVSQKNGGSFTQRDGTSCGAFLIENIYSDFIHERHGQSRWRNDNHKLALDIRTRHLNLLESKRPDYYQRLHDEVSGLTRHAGQKRSLG